MSDAIPEFDSEFDVSRYLGAASEDALRSPTETVLEYVQAYQKWARDCHHWAKANRDNVAALQTGAARHALTLIQQQYCAPANRQFQRASTGYYFFGGTYDVQPIIDSQSMDGPQSAIILTVRNKPRSPAFRFQLRKQGQRWLIRSLDRLDGTGHWVPDFL